MTDRHTPPFRAAFLAPRFWPTWLLYASYGCLALLPAALRSRLARALVMSSRYFPSRRRQIARTNLALCFPDRSESERERLLERHALLVAHVFLDYGRLMFGSRRSLERAVEVEGAEHLDAAIRDGRGVIVLTPHVVAMEQAGQWLNRRLPLLSIVRVHQGNGLLDWMVTRMRTRHGGQVVDHRAGMLTLIKAVRAGSWLYYLPDEDPGPDQGEFACFYGVPKATVTSLGRLARACRAPVLPMTSRYCIERQRFRLRFLPPLEWGPPATPGAEAEKQNRLLQSLVDVDPAQYMWSAKIFRSRPHGARNPY